MDDTREIEIKLLMNDGKREALLGHPLLQGAVHHQNLSAVYYDTADWRLHAAGALLRTRTAGSDSEQTLKLAAENHAHPVERAEWSCRIDGDAPAPDAFPAAARDALENLLDGRLLQPFAHVETMRGTQTVDSRGSTIELAIDTAKITAAERSATITELELELKQGRLRDLLQLVLALPLGPDLQWSALAKGERGFLLATGSRVGAIKATPFILDSTMSASAAFQRISWNCLDHILRNYRQVIDDCDAEALHQSRVALRRLRAGFSTFKGVIADDESDILRAELTAVASALAPARELDVLIGTVKAHSAVGENHPDSFKELLLELERQRATAYSGVCTLLRSAPFQRLLLETAAWIEDGGWLTAPEEDRSQARAMPIVDLVSRNLRTRRRTLEKAQRRLGALDVAALHRLRIKVKQLRYTVDFAASLFAAGKRAASQAAFSSTLAKLQDRLGELNDIATSEKGDVLKLSHLGEIERARLSALLAGILDVHGQSEKRLLRAAEKALEQTLLARHFWKKS